MPSLTLLVALALSGDPSGYSIASSDCIIVNAPSKDLCHAVLSQATALRKQLSARWLGEELAPSAGPCLINVTLSATRDEGTTWPALRPPRTHHVICLKTTPELAQGSTLAHEMTHVIMATQFGDSLPVWANEGAAGLQDDAQRAAIRRRLLSGFASRGDWPSLAEVLNAEFLSPSNQRQYTAAVALTEFLLTRGDERRFVRFAVDGRQRGWNQALREHYAMSGGVSELTRAWRNWETRGARLSSRSGKPVIRPVSTRR